jgi:hypothetical protein
VVSEAGDERVELHQFPFTRVRVTLGRGASGEFRDVRKRELAALKANLFWFPHDLYSPERAEDCGPLTIGHVIHIGRTVGFTGYIGGVAVFDSALTPDQMARLAGIAKTSGPDAAPARLRHEDVSTK